MAPGVLSGTALAALERAINHALHTDPACASRLALQAGKLIAVHLTVPPVSLYALLREDGIELYQQHESNPDVSVSGNPADLAALLLSWQRQPGTIGGATRIQGDQRLLQELRDMAAQLDVDWGALLEPLLGAELAQQLDLGSRRLFSWARQALSSLGSQTSDYLRGDSGLLVVTSEVQAFHRQVDRLRDDVGRLEARINNLRGRGEAG